MSESSKFNDRLPDEASKEELWIDRYLLPALREPTLFTMLLVFMCHVVAFMAPALLFAVRDQSFGSMLALFAIGVLTVQCIRFEVGRHGRLGVLSAILLSTWLASGVAAWVCDHLQLF